MQSAELCQNFMFKKKKIVAIIPARKGSKGIKDKNIKRLNQIPLVAYSITNAKRSNLIDKVFVTTDGEKIGNISKKFGAEVIKRPKNLCNDIIMPDYAVIHAIKYIEKQLKYDFDYVVFLQPTSPLRKKGELDTAIRKCIKNNVDTLFSSTDYKPFIWRWKGNKLSPVNFKPQNRQRRQINFEVNETGSFYIVKRESFLKRKNRFGKKIINFKSEFYNSLEIDTLEEFNHINGLLKSSILKKHDLCLPKLN